MPTSSVYLVIVLSVVRLVDTYNDQKLLKLTKTIINISTFVFF